MTAPRQPEYDCIIVGARCAGAPLAIHLRRAGMRVLLLDADKLHSDQPFSTHVIQLPGMDQLDELGVGDAVRACTPAVSGMRLEVLGHAYDVTLPEGRRMHCPRRRTLDPLLQDAALAAGAELRSETRVTELIEEAGRVCGVVVTHAGQTERIHGRFVVGADGRNSTVARLTGAETYIAHETERGGYWAYYPKPACWDRDEPWKRFGTAISITETARFCFETDGELLIMGAFPASAQARGWGKRHPEELQRSLAACPLTAPLIEAGPVGAPLGLLKAQFFFRRAVGPGWALVGDAGLHKDPTPGHGISDALRDARALARALVDGRPEALELYWRERDVASVPLYFQGLDMGRPAFANPFNALLMDRLNAAGPEQGTRMHEILERQRSPFDMVAPATLLGWVFGALLRGRLDVLGPFLAAGRYGAQVQRELTLRQRLADEAREALARAG